MWSAQPGVATFPTEVPRCIPNTSTGAPAPPLTLRLDPTTGICYVAGGIAGNGGGNGTVITQANYTLPDMFRVKNDQLIPCVNDYAVYLTVRADGTLTIEANVSTTIYQYTGVYYTGL